MREERKKIYSSIWLENIFEIPSTLCSPQALTGSQYVPLPKSVENTEPIRRYSSLPVFKQNFISFCYSFKQASSLHPYPFFSLSLYLSLLSSLKLGCVTGFECIKKPEEKVSGVKNTICHQFL
ncbi:uncharacterized protein CEXT_249991 [Caerostris extrusa]|uniref:Uncharacterized protein n=1 Tax=Caerostris extrusa TaxID=172846 RepID=A0AAV4XEL4_CAEEX|nr:uncharacterized protein CEXT_249991 [Caerostris extrusa]